MHVPLPTPPPTCPIRTPLPPYPLFSPKWHQNFPSRRNTLRSVKRTLLSVLRSRTFVGSYQVFQRQHNDESKLSATGSATRGQKHHLRAALHRRAWQKRGCHSLRPVASATSFTICALASADVQASERRSPNNVLPHQPPANLLPQLGTRQHHQPCTVQFPGHHLVSST